MMLLDIDDWVVLLGRTHPLIVHLPIGIVMMATFMEILALFQRFSDLKPAILLLWITAAVTSVTASLAGYILSQEGAYEEDLLFVHQWLGIALAILTMAIVLVKIYFSSAIRLQRVLYITAVIVLSAAGHYGGTLTHGEEFLGEPLASIFELGDEEEVKFVKREIPDMEKAIVYRDLIQPVLEQKCVKCHSAKKSKGKLRLDEYMRIVKGGKSGHTLVSGDPEQSELYKRILLPAEDKKRMPPKGKKQLTKDEINLIHWWIREGQGSEMKTVEQTIKPDMITHVLATYSTEEPLLVPRENEFPEVTVENPSAEAIRTLEASGVIVSRLAPDVPWLTVNCVNATDFGDRQTEMLLPLKDQIVWFKGGDTKISDAGLEKIAQLRHLTRLSLENTIITDQGVKRISDLAFLQYLNLVNTKVTDQSVSSIAAVEKLKAVYLWKSRLTAKGVDALKSLKPQAEINFGDTLLNN